MTSDLHHGPSYEKACEAIAAHWNSLQSERVYNAMEIYTYSPSGELFMINEWYWNARLAGFKGEDDTQTDEEFQAMMDRMMAQIRPELLKESQ